jgi:NADH-quinone oxidoreductase subunit J
MSLHAFLFYILAALTAVSAVAVVLTQNIVRSATWLLFALAGTAGIFFVLGADFIGATQLLIYVGGTLVLVVFGVMLTAQGPFINMRIGAVEWAIAAFAGLLLYSVLAISLWPTKEPRSSLTTRGVNTDVPAEERHLLGSRHLGAVLLGDYRATLEARLTGSPAAGKQTRSRMGYLLPFEIVSIHLLVVLIGAAYLARAKKRFRPSDTLPSSLAGIGPVDATPVRVHPEIPVSHSLPEAGPHG